jgi:hypothetical protein
VAFVLAVVAEAAAAVALAAEAVAELAASLALVEAVAAEVAELLADSHIVVKNDREHPTSG